MSPHLLRLLFVLAVALAPFGRYAHGLEHLAHHGGKHQPDGDNRERPCERCIAYSAIDAAAPAPASIGLEPVIPPQRDAAADSGFIPAAIVPFASRAPPA